MTTKTTKKKIHYEVYESAVQFGKALITAHDLDPIYEMLYHAPRFQGALSNAQLKRWLLAYWFFYHAGTASYIAEQSDFYSAALFAFDNRYPRGSERRHFRTSTARASLLWFKENYPKPELAVEDCALPTFTQIRAKVLSWPSFGPWIAFKVADMMERCLCVPVDFSDCELSFYEQPAQAAKLVVRELDPNDVYPVPFTLKDLDVGRVARLLNLKFAGWNAPPDYERDIDLQEIETVMCKYKSHRNGTYPLGKDLEEVFHALEGWGPLASELSSSFKEYLRTERTDR